MIPVSLLEQAQAGEPAAVVALAVVALGGFFVVKGLAGALLAPRVPKVVVDLKPAERDTVLTGCSKLSHSTFDKAPPKDKVLLWDPCTMDALGEVAVATPKDVDATCKRARAAADVWSKSSFDERRMVLRTILAYILQNQETIARVAVRESGKTIVDAMIGEILVTCEKLQWTINNGERWLKNEPRDVGALAALKKVYIKYQPMGVIGAIVPWNYPFHNVFNPLIATIMTGNALVIKPSEYASWSIDYYGRVLRACFKACGAPEDLVQFVPGYGQTGAALVDHPLIDKVIFVGSPGIGARVMEAAAKTLTPVVLELGGKDPFVVCEDSDVDSIVQTACRGVWQNMGQNCAGPERFFVYEGCYSEFCDKVTALVKQMKQGPPLLDPSTDAGGICMGKKQLAHYQNLIDDAVKKGAKILTGGFIPKGSDPLAAGSFYPPTVICDVPESALIAQEEIFGPIMCIFKVVGNSDDEAVRMANNCDFALGSCAFSGNFKRASAVASRLRAGFHSVNDFGGTTYLSQSLPWGGLRKSGFDKFAGPEGLRGLCVTRAVCEDWIPSIRNFIPPPLQYPSTGAGHTFAQGLILAAYGTVAEKLQGVGLIIKAFLGKAN